MIRADQYAPVLRALRRLIVQAKAQAFETGESGVGELLNDVEMLPDYLADESDRTGEFVEMLQGIAQMHPCCRYIVEEFERTYAAT